MRDKIQAVVKIWPFVVPIVMVLGVIREEAPSDGSPARSAPSGRARTVLRAAFCSPDIIPIGFTQRRCVVFVPSVGEHDQD